MKRLLALSLLLVTVSCVAPSAEFMAHYGNLDIDGDLGITTGAVVAQNDMNDAGFDDDEGVVGARVDLKFGGPHLSISVQDSSHDGSGTLTSTVSANGTTITAGTAVNSDLSLGLYSAILTWDILPTDAVELGLGFGVHVIDFDASITDPALLTTVEADEAFPIPVLAVRVAGSLGPIEAEGLLSGLVVDTGDVQVSYVAFDALGRWVFAEAAVSGALVLGYRLIDFDVEFDDGADEVDADIRFSGPFFGLSLGI